VRMLRRDVPEPPGPVAEQEEADDLEDALARPGVDIADVPELLDGRGLDAGLLADLAQRRQLGTLTRPDQAFREGPGALGFPGRPDGGHHRPAPQLPDDHSAGRKLPPHPDFVTQAPPRLAL